MQPALVPGVVLVIVFVAAVAIIMLPIKSKKGNAVVAGLLTGGAMYGLSLASTSALTLLK